MGHNCCASFGFQPEQKLVVVKVTSPPTKEVNHSQQGLSFEHHSEESSSENLQTMIGKDITLI